MVTRKIGAVSMEINFESIIIAQIIELLKRQEIIRFKHSNSSSFWLSSFKLQNPKCRNILRHRRTKKSLTQTQGHKIEQEVKMLNAKV